MERGVVEQVAIALFGVAAVFFSQDQRAERRRWAPVLGLLAQPFWFYAMWKSGQWGVFALCFLYAASWARGLYNFWIRPA